MKTLSVELLKSAHIESVKSAQQASIDFSVKWPHDFGSLGVINFN